MPDCEEGDFEDVEEGRREEFESEFDVQKASQPVTTSARAVCYVTVTQQHSTYGQLDQLRVTYLHSSQLIYLCRNNLSKMYLFAHF